MLGRTRVAGALLLLIAFALLVVECGHSAPGAQGDRRVPSSNRDFGCRTAADGGWRRRRQRCRRETGPARHW